MKIKKYRKLKDNRYIIFFDDDLEVKIYDDVIVKYNLLVKKEISNDEYNELLEYNNSLEAYYKTLKYITRKMRTEKEIIKYLEKDFDRDIINKVIVKLKNEKYLNDDLYIKCYVSDKLNLSNDGPNKIKRDLIVLGMKEESIQPYLNDIDDEVWLKKIQLIINKRIKCNHQYGMNKLKEKIVYDLSNLGYYKWMIENVITNSEFTNDDSLIEKEYNKWYKKLSSKYASNDLLFRIRNKLLCKGFTYDEIDNFLQNKKN